MYEELRTNDGAKRIVKIVPNENLTDIPYYEEENTEYFHLKGIRTFSDKYNLNYTDISGLIHDGYILVLIVIDHVKNISTYPCYVPKRISKKQYEWLLSEYNEILKYDTFGFDIEGDNGEPIREDGTPEELIDYFYELVSDCVENRSLK